MRQESINQIWQACQNGDPYAMTEMGLLFYEGKYVKPSRQQGFNLLQQAANNNVVWAQNLILYITRVNKEDTNISQKALVSTQAMHQLEQAGQNGNLVSFTIMAIQHHKTVTQQ